MYARLLLVLFACSLVPACSAIVAPDLGRLGAADAGPVVMIDAPGLDTGSAPDAPSVVDDTGTPIDSGPGCPATCDDGVACTTDGCAPGATVCEHVPSDAACGTGMRCVATGCVPTFCGSNADCDDGNACNGAENCRPGTPGASPTTGCASSDPPRCDDGIDCTLDACEPTTGCTVTLDDTACDDTTVCTADRCTNTGCVRTPDSTSCNGGCRTGAMCLSGTGCTGGTAVTCASDGDPCTSDPTTCDAVTGTCLHPPRDNDGDGYPAAFANGGAGTVSCMGGTDCDDANGGINPGATESCNGRDDDCNGAVDEGAICPPPGPDDCSTARGIPLAAGAGGLTGSANGSTATLDDDYTVGCGRSGGRDAVYFVDLTAAALGGAADVVISTSHSGTTFDTVIGTQAGGTCGSFGGACNDDISSTNNRSTVRTCVSTFGGTRRLYILIDGFDDPDSGAYTVSVTVTPRVGGVCG